MVRLRAAHIVALCQDLDFRNVHEGHVREQSGHLRISASDSVVQVRGNAGGKTPGPLQGLWKECPEPSA